jgi:hypothetical protein
MVTCPLARRILLAIVFDHIYNNNKCADALRDAIGPAGDGATIGGWSFAWLGLAKISNLRGETMFRQLKRRPVMMGVAGMMLGLLIGAGAFGVAMYASSSATPQVELDDLMLSATASHGEHSLTLATGSIDEEVEGVYVLDHMTGDLQCWVPSVVRPGTFSGQFKANVLSDLGADGDKAPQLVMVTSSYNVRGAASTTRPARTIVWVGDANTGNVAGYSIAWNRSRASSGGTQGGPLVKVLAGKGRTAAIRPGVGIGGPGGSPQR